jgi:hypothetical protein
MGLVRHEIAKRPASHWIKVTDDPDTLPPQGENVVYGAFIKAEFANGTETTNFQWAGGYYSNGKWYDDNGEEDFASHWMAITPPR